MTRRWNPWDDLERFEAKHGDHSAIITRLEPQREDYDGKPVPLSTEQRQLRLNLKHHSRLIWCCMAWNYGYEAGKAGLTRE